MSEKYKLSSSLINDHEGGIPSIEPIHQQEITCNGINKCYNLVPPKAPVATSLQGLFNFTTSNNETRSSVTECF